MTFKRWNRNPFQMWMLLAMIQVSLNQIIYAPETGTISELARQSQLWLAFCNLFGGVVVMSGLHMREKVLGLWIEMCGYIALVGSMGLYTYLVLSVSLPPNTSFGLGLSEAFVTASVHRFVLIAIDKFKAEWRYRKREQLHRQRLARAMEAAGLTEGDLQNP